ncbi:MAG: hypothetical protein Alpg2KO_01790 [Alphaproteobacteria bacterium]
MPDEIFDIFDASMRPLGSAPRDEVHAKGLWHRAVHVWIISGEDEGAILLQRRADDLRNNSGLFDISAAGHLTTGEGVEDGLREVEEELGIALTIDKAHDLGWRTEVYDDHDRGYHNREFQRVFMARMDVKLHDLTPCPTEVAGLYWLTLPDALDLFTGRVEDVPVEGVENGPSGLTPTAVNLTQGDFVNRIDPYYLSIALNARRYLDGERVLVM